MAIFSSSTLYLDFRETTVQIIKGTANKRFICVDDFSKLDLKDLGNVMDVNLDEDRNIEISKRLSELLKKQKLSSRRVIVNLSQEGIITRTVRVPALAKGLLTEFIKREINEFLPVDLSNYRYDYRIIRGFKKEVDGQEYYELLLVAVPQYLIEQTMQIMKLSNLRPVVIDVLPNALLRLFGQVSQKGIVVLDAGSYGGRVIILKDESPLLYADVPSSLWKMGENYSPLIEEVRGYLNYFSSRFQGQQVEALYIVGELVETESQIKEIFNELGVSVQVQLEKSGTFQYSAKTKPEFENKSAVYAANLGIMLRRDMT